MRDMVNLGAIHPTAEPHVPDQKSDETSLPPGDGVQKAIASGSPRDEANDRHITIGHHTLYSYETLTAQLLTSIPAPLVAPPPPAVDVSMPNFSNRWSVSALLTSRLTLFFPFQHALAISSGVDALSDSNAPSSCAHPGRARDPASRGPPPAAATVAAG